MTTTLAELATAADGGQSMSLPDGRTVELLRRSAGVTVTACAAAVGISERSWQRFEQGRTSRFVSPAIETRVARVVGLLAETTGELR